MEPDAESDALAHAVIGAAIEVHRELGPGFLETIYEEALAVEMTLRNIPFEKQKTIFVDYKGNGVGESRLDFLVGHRLVLEIKAVDGLAPVHMAQVISYLRASDNTLALLMNFNVPVLRDGIRRVVYTKTSQKRREGDAEVVVGKE